MHGFTFTLSSTSNDYTVTNTLRTKFPDVLTLTEVSLDKVYVFNKNDKYGSNITSKDVYLYITDTTGTILGISEAAAVSASKASNNTGGSVTFTLDCDGIKKDTAYRAWFMGTDTGYTGWRRGDVASKPKVFSVNVSKGPLLERAGAFYSVCDGSMGEKVRQKS